MFNFSREDTGVTAKWWRNVDKQILSLFIFLFFLGLFFSFSSTSSVVAEKMNKETYFFFSRHLIFVFISIILLISISIQEKTKINRADFVVQTSKGKCYTKKEVGKIINLIKKIK